jgi:hypothetical protein
MAEDPRNSEDPQIRRVVDLSETRIRSLIEEAARTESSLKLFVVMQDKEAKRALAKRAHDVTSALRTLRFALEALQSGYRFDDDLGSRKIESIEKALRTLERESGWLYHLFE